MDYVSVKKPLFGGEVEFVFYGISEDLILELVEEAYDEGLRLQKIFNFYDKNSELSKLNRKRKMVVSLEFLEVLEKALRFSELSGGKYDVSLGKSFLARKRGEEFFSRGSYKDIKISGREVEFLNEDVMVDLGSIAKGYIADKLAEFFIEKGIEEFLIDARGDIRVVGETVHDFGIKNPRGEGEIYKIKVKNESVATSGDYNQYSKNFEHSHILNQSKWASITVIGSNLEEADVYATLFFTLELDEIEKIVVDNKSIKVLIVDWEGNIVKLNGFDSLN